MSRKLYLLAILFALLIFLKPTPAIAETNNSCCIVSTLAGAGSHGAINGCSTAAQFNLPHGILGGLDGTLYIADTYNNLIRTINQYDEYTLVASLSGNISTRDESGFPLGFYRDGRLDRALFNRPVGGLIDQEGRIFIVDSANHAIRIIDGNNVYTFAGGRAGRANGSLASARFTWPSAIAMDDHGNIFVTDTLNHTIRRIGINGMVTTVAGSSGRAGYANGSAHRARFNSPMGIAVSPDGQTIYVADTGNHAIRVIENGMVRTLAGTRIDYRQQGEEAPVGGFLDGYDSLFNLPQGLFLLDDMLIVADSANHRIRAVKPSGEVITLAGTGEPGYLNGYANLAQFHFPRDVYVQNDNVYV
ncbi:MAG: hypothetical protein FWC91_10555, partial [Defluviitaleaceae bacterium]|nr:hypothetical protein [Defluviitaleaceae bacterium]